MPNYVDAFKDQDLYAINSVLAYHLPDPSSTIIGQYYNGDIIGTIYSYYVDKSGNLWWVIYENNDLSQMPFYVYNNVKALSVPGVNQPLFNIDTNKPLPDPSYGPPTIGENIANGLQNLSKSLGKYLPLIIGGVVLIALLPTINQLNRKK